MQQATGPKKCSATSMLHSPIHSRLHNVHPGALGTSDEVLGMALEGEDVASQSFHFGWVLQKLFLEIVQKFLVNYGKFQLFNFKAGSTFNSSLRLITRARE